MAVRATVRFRGRVQGVYFRAQCAKKAQALGLGGYVRNVPDGSVEAVFEGERAVIEECIAWNRTAQPYATVDRVDAAWGAATGEFRGFSVWHGNERRV